MTLFKVHTAPITFTKAPIPSPRSLQINNPDPALAGDESRKRPRKIKDKKDPVKPLFSRAVETVSPPRMHHTMLRTSLQRVPPSAAVPSPIEGTPERAVSVPGNQSCFRFQKISSPNAASTPLESRVLFSPTPNLFKPRLLKSRKG